MLFKQILYSLLSTSCRLQTLTPSCAARHLSDNNSAQGSKHGKVEKGRRIQSSDFVLSGFEAGEPPCVPSVAWLHRILHIAVAASGPLHQEQKIRLRPFIQNNKLARRKGRLRLISRFASTRTDHRTDRDVVIRKAELKSLKTACRNSTAR